MPPRKTGKPSASRSRTWVSVGGATAVDHRTERREQVQLAPDEPALQVERPAEVGLLVADGSPPR